MWLVQAQIEWTDTESGWSGSRQVPSFLIPDFLGATTPEAAEKVATDIIATFVEIPGTNRTGPRLTKDTVTVTPHIHIAHYA